MGYAFQNSLGKIHIIIINYSLFSGNIETVIEGFLLKECIEDLSGSILVAGE